MKHKPGLCTSLLPGTPWMATQASPHPSPECPFSATSPAKALNIPETSDGHFSSSPLLLLSHSDVFSVPAIFKGRPNLTFHEAVLTTPSACFSLLLNLQHFNRIAGTSYVQLTTSTSFEGDVLPTKLQIPTERGPGYTSSCSQTSRSA